MAASFDADPIVDRLERNAAVFSGLLDGVQEAQARWRPQPDKWSILEVVNHLADEEEQDFGTRLRLLLEQPDTEWPPIDPPQWAIDRQYNSKQLDESLNRFLQNRRQSIAWLRGLQQPAWQRAHQGAVGPQLRAGDLLCSWLEHDLIHIRQINRLHHEYLGVLRSEFSTEYAGAW
jgi:hypothetical protein